MLKNKKYDFKDFSFSLLAAVLLLCLIGVYCLFKSEGFSMARRQLIGIVIGLIVAVVGALIDYHLICKFAILYYIVGVIILVMVRFTSFGNDHTTGAYRWLSVGSVEIQPSELVKIIL